MYKPSAGNSQFFRSIEVPGDLDDPDAGIGQRGECALSQVYPARSAPGAEVLHVNGDGFAVVCDSTSKSATDISGSKQNLHS